MILDRFFSRKVAIGATICFLLSPALIIYTQIFEPEPFLVFSLVSFLWFAHQKSTRLHLVAGICFAFGILVRPNFLPVSAVLPMHFFWIHDGQVDRKKKWIISSLAFLLPVLFAIGLVLTRNAKAVGYFSPIIMNPGITVYEGNNPTSQGFIVVYPLLFDELLGPAESDYQHVLYRTFARRITQENLSIPRVNQYWSNKARNYWFDHPRGFPKHLAVKVFHFFHSYEWHDLLTAEWLQWRLQALPIPYIPVGFLSVMAIAGMILLRGRFRELILFYALLAMQLAVILAVYASARQRLAILFILFFFASAAFDAWIRSRKKVLMGLSITILGGLLLHISSDQIHEEKHMWTNIDRSHRFITASYKARKKGELKKAEEFASQARALTPWLADFRRPSGIPWSKTGFRPQQNDFSSQFDIVLLEINEKQIDRSPEILKNLIDGKYVIKRDQYVSSEPRYYLARIAQIRGKNHQEVHQLFLEAFERAPGDPWILSSLYALTTEPKYKNSLFKYFDDVHAHFFLGKAFFENQMYREAAEAFRYVTVTMPELRRGWIYLAASTGMAGDLKNAVAFYQKALEMQFDPVLLEEELVSVFLRFTESNPKSIIAQFAYGIVLRQFGRCEEALAAQRNALNLDPENSQVLGEIQSLENILPSCK